MRLVEAVDIWLREKRSKNVHISGTLLQETARDLAAKMGIEDFKGGNGWLSGFKERKGLSLRTIQGEAKSVNMDSVESWKSTVLADLLRTYGPDCIYNADETGLYYWTLLSIFHNYIKRFTFKVNRTQAELFASDISFSCLPREHYGIDRSV